MEATSREKKSFNGRAKDSALKADKNYDEVVMKSRNPTAEVGSTNKRGANLASPTIDLESFTPVTGPLKKRLKQRYSLGSNSSLFTPSGFYNLTPDFASCKKGNNKSLRDAIPTFRTPLTDISTPNAANFRDGSDEILKKPAPRFLSPKNENRKKPDHAVHLRSFAASALVQRKQKLRNLFQMAKSPRSHIPPTAKRTPILLPHSPIATKASNDIHRSSKRNTVSLEDDSTKSYMCLIRNQYEFFELSSEDVALCKERNVSVEEGQVALRCRHCTCIDLSFRPKGSLAVAKKHETLYKHFYDRKSTHVEELCPFVPKITRKKLVALRYRDSLPTRTPFEQDFAYWGAKAKALGVVETPRGLRFKSSLLLKAKTDRFSFPRSSAENRMHLQNLEHSKAVTSPPYEQYRLLQDQISKAVEYSHVSWGKTFASDNPNPTGGNLSSKVDMEECNGINDSDTEECDGLKGIIHPAQEAQTWRQKANERNWHNRLREFIGFKCQNGHGMVPQNYVKNRQLGIWVNKQRMAKRARDEGKTSSMTDERIKLLEKAGFTWAKPKGIRAWEEKFLELKKFFEEYGHCDVPTKWENNRSLGRFVSNLRKQYKEYVQNGSCSIDKNEMDRRIRLLEGINFSWSLAPDSVLSEEFENDEE